MTIKSFPILGASGTAMPLPKNAPILNGSEVNPASSAEKPNPVCKYKAQMRKKAPIDDRAKKLVTTPAEKPRFLKSDGGINGIPLVFSS